MTQSDSSLLTNGAVAPVSASEMSSEQILDHYFLCCVSRACSVLARKEVLTGKAKFGIIGDGKELPQVALATQFRPGDWRAGYYRDQTIMLALDLATPQQLFAQLYADPQGDPFSGGRQMNSHFATPMIDEDGELLPLGQTLNISSDISCTAGQMARGLGLALASKKFRQLPSFDNSKLSTKGDEISWVTIGDASTSEGVFWETMNAAGVMQVPLVVRVWDDGYGISVPIEYQTTKQSISEALAGLQQNDRFQGIEIIRVKAWDYPGLLNAYQRAASLAREEHVPVLVHVIEVTQQLGHSTSGSHERYKSPERLQFEKDYDCNARFEEWIVAEGYATKEETAEVRKRAEAFAKTEQQAAWQAMQQRVEAYAKTLAQLLPTSSTALHELTTSRNPSIAEVLGIARRHLLVCQFNNEEPDPQIESFVAQLVAQGNVDYSTNLYAEGEQSALRVPSEAAVYEEDAASVPAFKILNQYFDSLFERDKRVLAFGEDVGHIGDVNQGFANLQKRYGEDRIFDTGIREWTIIGQAIGLAMRGFRPIAEIQYLDYLVYAMSALTDDLATLRYRSNGMQRAPVVVRTRGHRLEGIWHSGSPMGMMIHSLRGMYICTPRNALQAVGMYNALFAAEEPGVVIETLNAYRLREKKPRNLESYTVALGRPDILQAGTDMTVLTYGATVQVVERAIELIAPAGLSIEFIDAQTLLPFDVDHEVGKSVRKTNRLLIVDEDVPGGASAYLLDCLLKEQDCFEFLDAEPVLLTAKAHRSPYGSDGDYFTKPNAEDVAEAILTLASA